jgi:glucosylceramidase
LLFPGKEKQTDVFSVKDRTVTVYTSANSTDLRLTKTNTNLQFKDLKQPLETQVCVFVNPAKTFQTYLGWWRNNGCKCYCFAKLTKENQQEFLDA